MALQFLRAVAGRSIRRRSRLPNCHLPLGSLHVIQNLRGSVPDGAAARLRSVAVQRRHSRSASALEWRQRLLSGLLKPTSYDPRADLRLARRGANHRLGTPSLPTLVRPIATEHAVRRTRQRLLAASRQSTTPPGGHRCGRDCAMVPVWVTLTGQYPLQVGCVDPAQRAPYRAALRARNFWAKANPMFRDILAISRVRA